MITDRTLKDKINTAKMLNQVTDNLKDTTTENAKIKKQNEEKQFR
jgi:hypothetical protein